MVCFDSQKLEALVLKPASGNFKNSIILHPPAHPILHYCILSAEPTKWNFSTHKLKPQIIVWYEAFSLRYKFNGIL